MSFKNISILSLSLVLIFFFEAKAQDESTFFDTKIQDDSSEAACFKWGESTPVEVLTVFAEKFSPLECYAKKKSYDRLQPDEKISELELIKTDKEVCECIRRKETKLDSVETFQGTLKKFSQKSMLKEASLEKSYRHARTTFQNVQIMNAKSFAMHDEVTATVYSCPPTGCKDSEQALSLIVEEPFAPYQCISHSEWLSFERTPRDKILLAEFQKEFKEDDWKQSMLQEKYDDLMKLDVEKRKKHKDEILLLKSKLKFLFKNPQFSQVFGADHGSVKKEIVEKSGLDSSEIEKAFKKDNIRNSKLKLFGMLKNISSGCDLSDDKCLKEKTKDGQIDSFQKEVNSFILRPEIIPILKVVKARDEEVLKKRDQKFKSDLSFIDNFKSNPSQKNLVSQSMKETGLNPADCTGGGPDYQKCFISFRNYCEKVDKALPIIELLGKDESLNDDLDFDRNNFTDSSLATNLDFKKFNNAICNTRRKRTDSPEEASLTFFEFKKGYCDKYKLKPECHSNDLKDLQKLRKLYLSDYTEVADSAKKIISNDAVLAFHGMAEKSPVISINRSTAQKMFNLSPQERNQRLEAFRETLGLNKPVASLPTSDSESGSSFTKTLESLSKLQDAEPQTKEKAAPENFFSSNAFQNELAESVNTLTPPQRVEQLEKFKDQHSEIVESLKKDPASEAKIAEAKELELKIAALEASLAEVRKQNELLGSKLSEQSRQSYASAEKLAKNEIDHEEVRAQKPAHSQVSEVNNEVLRSPASVKAQNFESAGSAQVGAGAGALGGAGGKASGSSSVDSTSKSSIEREEAKLVSLRQGGNGLIIIDTSKGQVAPNAITVPVPEDIYRMVQSNPSGFSLSQIEKRITKDQISQLEKQGVIVLLLQNGSNPPIEVKVRKEKNGLVQIENTKAIVRRASLGGLQQTFKNY